jgi:ankyrin repeat protein
MIVINRLRWLKTIPPMALAVGLLLSCRAATEAPKKMKLADYFPEPWSLALAEAAARGEIAAAAKLTAAGVDINARGKEGMTPLLCAMIKRSKVGFKFLLEHGANPNLQLQNGESVMSLAAMHEDADYLKLALAHGGDPNLVDPESATTPVFDTIRAIRVENLKILIGARVDLNFRDRTGTTPLIMAANTIRNDMAYLMLVARADPAITNRWGKSIVDRVKEDNVDPKHELYQWREKVIELLKAKGVEVERGK